MNTERNARLADATQRLLSKRKLSLRAAEGVTGVSYNVILNMKDGKRPAYDSILRFARGMEEDPLRWLEIAGYTDLVELMRPRPTSEPTAERERSAYLQGEVFPYLLEDVVALPPAAQRHYAVAVRAFTTAWLAGWEALQEEPSR